MQDVLRATRRDCEHERECFRSFIIPRGLLRLILHVPIYWPDFSDTINRAANRLVCMAIQNAAEARKSVRLLLNGLSSLSCLFSTGGGRGATLKSIIRGEAPPEGSYRYPLIY